MCHEMFYYTHHSDMDSPQYVDVDAPWDIEDTWILYYTHYRDMYIPQYVKVDEISI